MKCFKVAILCAILSVADSIGSCGGITVGHSGGGLKRSSAFVRSAAGASPSKK
jgi:hypothetical protein